jgi:hypothetical protein
MMSVELQPQAPSSRHTSHQQDLVTALLGSWITLGGFIDGFAHRNLDTPETFFTPWHGVLYAGYLATVLWIVLLIRRLGRIPVGYSTALAGVVVFAAGGIGDMFWHTIFGIEVSVDALLSPTHLMLLVGALLMLSGPILSRAGDPAYNPPTLRALAGPIIAFACVAAELGFFFQYIDGFSVRFMQVAYVPGSEEGFFEVATGISSILISTVITMGTLFLMMRRWRLPFGAGLAMFALVGLLMEMLEGYDFPEDVIAPVIGGLTIDLLLRLRRPLPVRWFAFLVPVAMWIARFAVFEAFADINWPVSVWTGIIAFSGLAGVGLSLLAFPPALLLMVDRAGEPSPERSIKGLADPL